MRKFLAAFISLISVITFTGGFFSYAQNTYISEAGLTGGNPAISDCVSPVSISMAAEVNPATENTLPVRNTASAISMTLAENTVSAQNTTPPEENTTSENTESDPAAAASGNGLPDSTEKQNTAKNEKGVLGKISYSKIGGNDGREYEQIHINASGYASYGTMELTEPLRLVIDLKNTQVPGEMGIVQAGGNYVKRIRFAQFTVSTARVVLDLKKEYAYSIEQTDGGLTVLVYKPETGSISGKNKAIRLGGGYGIELTGSGINEKVTVKLGSCENYSIARVTNPEKLIITIPDAGISGRDTQIETAGSRVSSIGYKKSGQSGAVITIGLTSQFQYTAEESDGKLVLSFRWPSYKNIIYENNQDRVHLVIKKARLTEGTKNLKPLYTESLDESSNVYMVTFPAENADIGEGILDINDSYLKSFEVKKNSDGTTSLIFTGQSPNRYLVYTRDSGDTAITIVKESDAGRNLVVIDAGHGGTASGAYYGKLYEKSLNLDIAKRLNALLEKAGIATYMIRSDDTNVDNYERVYIANMLDAGLYLSVHNNAAASKSIKGIMTLYCPSSESGFTGKDFAEIVQNELLNTLKNKNLNVRSRPDLIVLRETNMPAVIAEVAFLSNSQDRANLQKESYRQKAAQALYNSVIKALDKAGGNEQPKNADTDA